MSYLQRQMNVLKFDRRLLEINLKNGTITEEDYKNHLSALADSEGNSEKLDLGTNETQAESMNGGQHPADSAPAPAQPAMPTNNDPFGSGY